MDEILVAIQEAADTIAAPNWADIMGVCFSLTAVVVACIVAWRQNKIVLKQAEIAEQQNKIELFEKRYEVYDVISKISAVASEVIDVDRAEKMCIIVQDKFELGKRSSIMGEYDETALRSIISEIPRKLAQSEFLFSQEIYKAIISLDDCFIHFIFGLYFFLHTKKIMELEMEGLNAAKMKFCKAVLDFYNEKTPEQIKEDLQLQSIKL